MVHSPPYVASENMLLNVDTNTEIRQIPLSDRATCDNVLIRARYNDICCTTAARCYDIHVQGKQQLSFS